MIGPDWAFSLGELFIINGVLTTLAVFLKDKVQEMFYFCVCLQILQNIGFLSTFMQNPGLPERNPRKHS